MDFVKVGTDARDEERTGQSITSTADDRVGALNMIIPLKKTWVVNYLELILRFFKHFRFGTTALTLISTMLGWMAWCTDKKDVSINSHARTDSSNGPKNEIVVVPDFHKRILFSDEAHFWLNGYVNKQNCRIWSEANPQVYVETPLHPEKLTVWCTLWAGGIIGPYFYKNDEGHNVTLNGDRYRAMITNFFVPELNNHDVQELWFQQDGATCHTARATIDLLKDTFGDRLISRFGPVNWPPRSCDLAPLDYILWSLVYADKPQTLHHLEDNIRRVIADIRPQMLEKVIENWTSRLDCIPASRGSHMPEIIFKM
ncbi:DUF4817 domain-containing protein [Trichonephila clavipes]|uniref:DUF4817 domain-containing protein n=1 Tax=Trichonephila clavipes TaxID=2585209 RepID=A0A8X6W2B2_TRICX|nr:DUF4817 domain-containing protein [Trichonephila clavipes]